MSDSLLKPTDGPMMASQPALARKPVVDLCTRIAHASMALAFVVSYLTAESEYWRLLHVYSGYSLAAVLVFRFVWGWIGPASARWGLLWRRWGLWHVWLKKFKEGEGLTRNFGVGVSSWLLGAAVAMIYVFCTLATASGWATYNELLGDGWFNDALQELHEILGTAAMTLVCMHVGLVVFLRVWRGPQALRPMWRAYANTTGRR